MGKQYTGRDALMVRLINGATKSGPHEKKRKPGPSEDEWDEPGPVGNPPAQTPIPRTTEAPGGK